MDDIRDGTSDGEGDILVQRIIKAWIAGKNLKQISDEVDQPVKVVGEILKRAQKDIVKRGGYL